MSSLVPGTVPRHGAGGDVPGAWHLQDIAANVFQTTTLTQRCPSECQAPFHVTVPPVTFPEPGTSTTSPPTPRQVHAPPRDVLFGARHRSTSPFQEPGT